jgi:tellurite resistance protein TerC
MVDSLGSPTLWLSFTVFIVAMLALDLGVLHRTPHDVGVKEALGWSLVWVALALVFAGGLYKLAGPTYAVQFVTGYLIEKALSVDNVFVFLVVFSFFKVPSALQHRVLFWGIFGAQRRSAPERAGGLSPVSPDRAVHRHLSRGAFLRPGERAPPRHSSRRSARRC